MCTRATPCPPLNRPLSLQIIAAPEPPAGRTGSRWPLIARVHQGARQQPKPASFLLFDLILEHSLKCRAAGGRGTLQAT